MRGSVRGDVVRVDSGKPVAGTTITGNRWEGHTLASAPYTVTVTDHAGQFTFDALREGNWHLRAHGGDGAAFGEATVPVFDNAVTEVTIEVERTPDAAWEDFVAYPTDKSERKMRGSVHGRVVRADEGQPLRDATVVIVSGAGSAPDIAPMTDSSGHFVLDGLSAGDWLLRALGPGGEIGEAIIRVSADTVTTVTIEVVDTGAWAVPESE